MMALTSKLANKSNSFAYYLSHDINLQVVTMHCMP